jgi:hypothetical protein
VKSTGRPARIGPIKIEKKFLRRGLVRDDFVAAGLRCIAASNKTHGPEDPATWVFAHFASFGPAACVDAACPLRNRINVVPSEKPADMAGLRHTSALS